MGVFYWQKSSKARHGIVSKKSAFRLRRQAASIANLPYVLTTYHPSRPLFITTVRKIIALSPGAMV
jgi:hypothetical protein